MECQRARQEILESFDGPQRPDVRAGLDAHVRDCIACATFAERHRALDRRLMTALVPPEATPRIRARLRERIHHERQPFWSDLLPDAVHFGSCALVAVLCVTLLPVSAPIVLTVAVVGSLLAHVVLTAAHDSLDAADETGS